MKAFRNPFLLVVLFCSLFLVKCTCKDKTENADSLVKLISQPWKISELTKDGVAITTGIDAFVLTLKQANDAPTTYSITPGGLAYSFAPTNSGAWSLSPNNDNPTSITFSGATSTLLNASKDQLVIQFKATKEQDKNEPTWKFTLVPR